MGKAGSISGAFWFLFAVFVGYHSYRLGLGTLRMPGPGFLFFWTAVFIATLAVVDIWKSIMRTGPTMPRGGAVGRKNLTKIALVLLSLFLYVVFIERLGFIPMTLVLFLFLLAVIEKKKWYFALFASVIVTAVSYLVFDVGLQSQLPKGLLDFLHF